MHMNYFDTSKGVVQLGAQRSNLFKNVCLDSNLEKNNLPQMVLIIHLLKWSDPFNVIVSAPTL